MRFVEFLRVSDTGAIARRGKRGMMPRAYHDRVQIGLIYIKV